MQIWMFRDADMDAGGDADMDARGDSDMDAHRIRT